MKEDIIEFYEGKLLTSYENNNIVYDAIIEEDNE
jgi:hypothetical protein